MQKKARHFCYPILFAAFLLTLDFGPWTLDFASGTREGRLVVFDDVWETIRDRYYDPAFHGIDWQAQRAMYRGRAADAHSDVELYAVLRRMVSALRDAHTRVYAPDEKFDWQHPRFISTGLSVREVGGEALVIAVEHGSDAEREGLRAGDLIVSVDDQPALAVFTRRLQEGVNSSTAAAARFEAMAKLFDGPRDSTVKVGWVGADGRRREARLRREWRERDAGLHLRRIRGGYRTVEFDAFTQTVANDLTRALSSKLRRARGLVLDLRDNGGGDAEAMTEVASAFLPAGKSLGRFTDRNGRVTFEPQTRNESMFSADRIARFHAPVVILTSERTASAAEIFVAAMVEARRAVVVGSYTCGCVLAIRRRHTLPDGGALDVSEMDYHTAAGARLEGTGIRPTEEIIPDRRDIQAHRDRAIEHAVERLKGENQNR